MAFRMIRKTCVCSICIAFPHRHNRYRPYAIRHPILAAISAFLVVAKGTSVLLALLTPQTAYLSNISAPYLVDRTNQARAEVGLPPLSVNPLLQESAKQKARDMFAHNYFAHVSPQGVTPWQWFDGVGYAYIYAGENLAIDFQTGEGVHTAWMESPGHRKNILSDNYREIGIAVVSGEFDGRTTTIVVQHFGSIVAQAVPQQQESPPPPAQTEEPAPEPEPTPPAPAPATPRPVLEPIPRPVIIEPEEGKLLPSGAATVRGTAFPDSMVHILMDDDPIGSWPAVGGSFHGSFTPPSDTERDALLTARAEYDGRFSQSSDPRRVVISTTTPSLATDEAFFAPDPSGDITSLLLVIPVTDAIAEVTADIGRINIPMDIEGSVASARVAKRLIGREFHLHVTDLHGNSGIVSLQPLRVFHTVQRSSSETYVHQQVTTLMIRFQNIAFWALVAVIVFVAPTMLFRLRAENTDIVAHAIFVIALGTALLFVS